MADFNTVGIDDVINDMMHHQQAAEEAIPEMLKAGAEILVKAQKTEAQAMKIRDTGDFINSIKPTNIKKDKDDNSYVDVYPQGKDHKGTRNADKGFIAEYGTSKIPARPWMRTANEKCSDEITETEKEIWDNHKGG
ncbi:HK97-gp10 family putative phage morphogenesis protein [Caproiciproducens sp.]